MKRQRSSTDGLADDVANRLDRDQLRHLLARITATTPDALEGLLTALEQLPEEDVDRFRLSQVINFLRDSELGRLLHDRERGKKPVEPLTNCKTCGRTLPERGRGRPRIFCSSACRQMDYRYRNEGNSGYGLGRSEARLLGLRGTALLRTQNQDRNAVIREDSVAEYAVQDGQHRLRALGLSFLYTVVLRDGGVPDHQRLWAEQGSAAE